MIQLQRQVQVSTFDAEATVAVGKDRPEFLAVALSLIHILYPPRNRKIPSAAEKRGAWGELKFCG